MNIRVYIRIKPNEIEVKNKVDEVVPMFYEMLCADEKIDKDISVEVLKRSLILIQTDEKEELSAKQLQLFNSYYYAIAL